MINCVRQSPNFLWQKKNPKSQNMHSFSRVRNPCRKMTETSLEEMEPCAFYNADSMFARKLRLEILVYSTCGLYI